MNYEPMNGRVIVELFDGDKSGALVILPTDSIAGRRGAVVAISDDYYVNGTQIPMKVKVGDEVLLAFVEKEFQHDGKSYGFVGYESIMAKINK